MQTRSDSHIYLNGHVPLGPRLRKASRRRPLSCLLAALLALGLAGALLLTGCDGGPGAEDEVRLSPDVVALQISEGEIDALEQYPDYRLIIEMTNTADIALTSVTVNISLRDGDRIVENTNVSTASGDPLAPDETQIFEEGLLSAYDEYRCISYSITIGYLVKLDTKDYAGTCG